jgi:ankyrin repeat protein
MNGHLKVAEFLHSKGANINAKAGVRVPADVTCLRGHAVSLSLSLTPLPPVLIARGARVLQDNVTALMLASHGGHVKEVRFLLNAHASVNDACISVCRGGAASTVFESSP